MGALSDMLTNSPIRPTIPVVDLNRAKKFYETTLGLKPVHDNNDDTTLGIAIFECENSTILELYQRGPSKQTILWLHLKYPISKMRSIH